MNETTTTNEPPSNIWKRPWRGPARILAWLVLLIGGGALAICCIALLTEKSARHWGGLIPFALFISVVLAGLLGVLAGAFHSFRRLCCWRNLRRSLFATACLLTLIALAYAEENWRGKHAWQAYRQEWEAKGEKFDLAAFIPPQVADDKNLALTPLLKPMLDFTQGPTGIVWRDTNGLARLRQISAELPPKRNTNNQLARGSLEKGTFADLAACRDFYRGNTNYPQAAAPASAAEEILVALGKFDPELMELRGAAATRPYSRFPIQYDYQPAWGILLPHLGHIETLTTLLHVRATAELETGRSAEAFEDLKLELRLSDSLRDEPILIDHLVRAATLSISLQTVREGLLRHAWSEAQLVELENYLASLNLLAEYKLAMRGERAFEMSGLDYLRRQGFRLNAEDFFGDNAPAPMLNAMPGGWFYQNMLLLSQMHHDFTLPAVDERARRVFPEISENGSRAVENLGAGPYTIFAKVLLPPLGKAIRKSARMQTYVDAARVACALERYRLLNGNCPDTLAPLVPRFIDAIPNDIIDGKPLRCRLNSDGSYILYSVGWNQTDDGGELALTGQKKQAVEITKGDWVWRMNAR